LSFFVVYYIMIIIINKKKTWGYILKQKTLKIVGIGVGIFILIIIGLYFLGRSGGGLPPSTGTITVQTGTDDPAKVVDIEQKLTTLFLDYRDAQLETNALLLIDPTQTTPEKYAQFGAKVVSDWKNIEDESNNLTVSNGLFNMFNMLLGIPKAFAANSNQKQPTNITFGSGDYASVDLSNHKLSGGDNSEVGIVPGKWETVNAIHAMVPKASTLTTVQNVFGTTARSAQTILADHNTSEANNFNNTAAWYQKASTTATAVNTASKVSLFVGGAIITAGGSAVLAGPAGAAIATGFGANVGVVGGTVIVANGVGVVLEVGKNSASLGFATEKTAATFSSASDAYQPVSDVLAIAGLNSGTTDPGNLYAIYDFSARGYALVTADLAKDGKTIVIRANQPPPTFYAPTLDGLIKNALPSDFKYNIVVPNSATQNNAPAANEQVSGAVLPSTSFGGGLGSWYEETWYKKTGSGGEVSTGNGATFNAKEGTNSRAGVMIDLNKDVSSFNSLTLSATVEADMQTLSGTGWQGREAPVAIAVSYQDVEGNEHNLLSPDSSGPSQMFWRGFYYLDPAKDDNSKTTHGIKVAQGQSYSYSYDLMNLSPKPKKIYYVAVEGAGWGPRTGRVSSISITGGK